MYPFAKSFSSYHLSSITNNRNLMTNLGPTTLRLSISGVYITSCYVQKPTLAIILMAALSSPWRTKKALLFSPVLSAILAECPCDPRMLLVLKSIWNTAGKATINKL